jgi:hypothetical protein
LKGKKEFEALDNLKSKPGSYAIEILSIKEPGNSRGGSPDIEMVLYVPGSKKTGVFTSFA